MTQDPLADIVSHQYEKWVYPAPIEDLETWLLHNWQWFDPSHASLLMWPDRGYREGLDILVAGCGTSQAAVIAYTNPTARVLAIDVSNASLDHHRRLKERYGLANLELHQLPIEQVTTLGRDFDLVITTGVLHHMADPALGMRSLGDCLRPEGVLAVMVYADHGRIGVQMMQSVFAELGLVQDEPSLDVVRDAVGQLGPLHPLASYLQIAPDLGDDAGLVDTFLHGREAAYSIDQCRELVAGAGLAFQGLFLMSSYYPPLPADGPFLSAVSALPREQQWSIMQRINASNACHYFLACRPERDPATYVIDVASSAAGAYVPSFRKGCGLRGSTIYKSGWERGLTPLQSALVASIDGHRSIDEIVGAVVSSGSFARADRGEVRTDALEVFRSLWQEDFLAMGLRHPVP